MLPPARACGTTRTFGSAHVPGRASDLHTGFLHHDPSVQRTFPTPATPVRRGRINEGPLRAQVVQLTKLKAGAATRYTFDQAAAQYVTLYHKKVSFELEESLLRELMPYLGLMFLDQIYDATLEPFKTAMRERGWKSKSISLALGVVRRILNLAARSWRDEDGRTWLAAPPLLTMVEGGDQREPRQLTWVQQRALLPLLPDHLARMALFDLQCGARDAVVSGLRWEWEVRLPEIRGLSFRRTEASSKG